MAKGYSLTSRPKGGGANRSLGLDRKESEKNKKK
ncbi:hypothetical protein SAMN05443144_12081 [Fodinibius roseus]|uniref:Uncharacterized protein n=1 Tax=Fodinibius roseus TaxID=1194090 RepID=A0A1M5HM20_9BACT|nr:hypothetical protein SAMN05443144_12081 [Fodinibius roseus]